MRLDKISRPNNQRAVQDKKRLRCNGRIKAISPKRIVENVITIKFPHVLITGGSLV